MLTNTDFSQFKYLLETQKQSLLQSIDQEMNSLRALTDPDPDLLDAASISLSQENSAGWIKYLKTRRIQIEEALRRIENGTYGICPKCGKDIEIERLRAKPYARFCIRCRKNNERRHPSA